MDFASATMVRLAVPATRAGLFGTAALRHVLAAAYDHEPDELGEPPFTPSFDEFQLGYAEPHLVGVTGGWAAAGAPSTDVRLQVDGLDRAPGTRVDAVWRGTVTARLSGTLAPIDRVRTATSFGPDPTVAVQVRYAAAAPAPERPTPYPVAAALLIRDAGASLPDLLAESKALAGRLERLGLARPADAGHRVRTPVVVAWLVPAAVFDDADWPGADPAARITEAGRWLAREGVALVPVDPPA